MNVFVTVGTTLFDELVAAVDSLAVYEALLAKGFTSIIFQIGRGTYEPKHAPPALAMSFYRYNTEYKRDIAATSLVISHAGAGTIMDVLNQHKHLIVVPNTKLMDNHQTELATALAERKHLLETTIQALPALVKAMDWTDIVPYPAIDEQAFPRLVDAVMEG
ncbi:UDP-N-acetylglucosamine transferase subunit [Thraustotheca clavata]|uniref:UDP-N-acetylglucosamine transferase subunit ALG13 n=1 Tax=Thraustotheca clavata TaxID=74557 RepID=A0A1V9YYG2_9STRA|nr:UDP-N-acetylglucosamine transferase subunit [Thraustotheca clavata]